MKALWFVFPVGCISRQCLWPRYPTAVRNAERVHEIQRPALGSSAGPRAGVAALAAASCYDMPSFIPSCKTPAERASCSNGSHRALARRSTSRVPIAHAYSPDLARSLLHRCIDPAEPAQVKRLMQMPEPGSSCQAPGAGVGRCRSVSNRRSRGWRVGSSRSGADARTIP